MREQVTFGAELRRLRRAAGISLAELADRVHYSKGYLSKVETGLAKANSALAELCEAELEAPDALIGLLPQEPIRRRTRPDVRPSGLSPLASHFVGRADELRQVRQALEIDGGVCVISGPGGIGKTELALRCAHRLEAGFADGCLFVDLRGYHEQTAEPTAVHDRLLRTLGVAAEAVPSDPDDRAALYRSRFRGRSYLLVLDNASSAAQVKPLLPAEPKSRVLITSRSHLAALDDARHVSLAALPGPTAVELFSLLTGVDASDTVTRIVDHCGRLPLAIRIAAARLRTHTTWDACELDRRLSIEQTRLAELDDGERSMSAAFELSARRLAHAEARLLGLLALHPGADFDILAAGALGGCGDREADRLLDRLHDVYLLIQPAPDRYAFHDLVRAFAGERTLTAIPEHERAAAFRRLLDFTVRTVELADQLLEPHRYRPDIAFPRDVPSPKALNDEDGALAWLRIEWPNLVALCRSAGERGEHDRCWQLAFFLRSFFFHTKLWDHWVETHRWALASAKAMGDHWALATTTVNLGIGLIDCGDLDGASACYQEALVLYREIGDSHGESTALAHQAWAEYYRGDSTSALRDLRAALAFYERTGSIRNAAITTRGLSLVLTALGEATEAATLAKDALAVFEQLGLGLDAAMALNCMGWAFFHIGDRQRAAEAYQDAIRRAATCGSTYEVARAYTGLGNVAKAGAAHDEAVAMWALADETHPRLDPVIVGEARARARAETKARS